MTFAALGDSALVATLGAGPEPAALRRVRILVAALEKARLEGIVDVVPAYATVAIFYDPARFGGGESGPYEAVCGAVSACAAAAGVEARRLPRAFKSDRTVEIPVCYGGEFGPDLADVADHCKLSAEEVIARHGKGDYQVQAVGFAPGFAYLGGLPEKLHAPRRDTPREKVPAGSVGIGGAQTGIYPLATPGGWNLIGRTPLALFDAGKTPPALLRMGDRVTFRAITAKEFAAWE